MESLFAALESTAVAEYLRVSRWGYAAVNTAHILGIALLVGAIIPFNLHILGLWRSIPRVILARVLLPVAATGLVLAVAAGALLFSVKASEYSQIVFLQIKIVLVAVGTVSALMLHRAHGLSLDGANERRLRVHAVVSMLCWIGALISGRLIAFVQ
ncbi:MAG: hypothetical protein SV201_01085 [Pseudomonadota bacterium]|nr:hypothetical protein [Pseudomonadota bacterium]